jgi:hypothetical protein
MKLPRDMRPALPPHVRLDREAFHQGCPPGCCGAHRLCGLKTSSDGVVLRALEKLGRQQ